MGIMHEASVIVKNSKMLNFDEYIATSALKEEIGKVSLLGCSQGYSSSIDPISRRLKARGKK